MMNESTFYDIAVPSQLIYDISIFHLFYDHHLDCFHNNFLASLEKLMRTVTGMELCEVLKGGS